MNKIQRYEELYGGDFIVVEDLIQWLHDHARHGDINSVYSDLFKALGVVNTVVGIADVSNPQLNNVSEP